MGDFFARLPDDILLRVGEYLSRFSIIHHAATLSQRWRKVLLNAGLVLRSVAVDFGSEDTNRQLQMLRENPIALSKIQNWRFYHRGQCCGWDHIRQWHACICKISSVIERKMQFVVMSSLDDHSRAAFRSLFPHFHFTAVEIVLFCKDESYLSVWESVLSIMSGIERCKSLKIAFHAKIQVCLESFLLAMVQKCMSLDSVVDVQLDFCSHEWVGSVISVHLSSNIQWLRVFMLMDQCFPRLERMKVCGVSRSAFPLEDTTSFSNYFACGIFGDHSTSEKKAALLPFLKSVALKTVGSACVPSFLMWCPTSSDDCMWALARYDSTAVEGVAHRWTFTIAPLLEVVAIDRFLARNRSPLHEDVVRRPETVFKGSYVSRGNMYREPVDGATLFVQPAPLTFRTSLCTLILDDVDIRLPNMNVRRLFHPGPPQSPEMSTQIGRWGLPEAANLTTLRVSTSLFMKSSSFAALFSKCLDLKCLELFSVGILRCQFRCRYNFVREDMDDYVPWVCSPLDAAIHEYLPEMCAIQKALRYPSNSVAPMHRRIRLLSLPFVPPTSINKTCTSLSQYYSRLFPSLKSFGKRACMFVDLSDVCTTNQSDLSDPQERAPDGGLQQLFERVFLWKRWSLLESLEGGKAPGESPPPAQGLLSSDLRDSAEPIECSDVYIFVCNSKSVDQSNEEISSSLTGFISDVLQVVLGDSDPRRCCIAVRRVYFDVSILCAQLDWVRHAMAAGSDISPSVWQWRFQFVHGAVGIPPWTRGVLETGTGDSHWMSGAFGECGDVRWFERPCGVKSSPKKRTMGSMDML